MSKIWFKQLVRKRIFVVLLIILQVFFLLYMLQSGSLVSEIIGHTMTAISISTVLYIFSRRDKGAYKMTWIFLILLFPVFGGLFYLIFNFQLSSKICAKKIETIEEKTKDLYEQTNDDYQKAIEALPCFAPQIDYLYKYCRFPIYKNNYSSYLTPGEKKLEALIEELKKAKHYIFLEYFIVEEGKMWDSIFQILKQKAAQGVDVRLIYDDMGCFFLLPKDFPDYLKKYNIKAVVFNPFTPVLKTMQNNRDHRKIAVIDGKVAFTGGINIADEYINAIEKHGHWKDAAIMIKGKAAWSMTVIFLRMWELVTGKSENYQNYFPENDNSDTKDFDGFVQAYSDSPMDTDNVSEHVYLQIINNAKQYIYINTPYLIIDDSMISALCLAAKSGVDVRIVTPHKWDKWIIHFTTRSYYRELIKSGVKIYEYSKGFIHSKIFVSDDITATVGTANLDFRSLYMHFECGVRLYGSKSVTEIKNDFLDTLNSCEQISYEKCKNNILTRFFQDIMRILAPLL